MSVPTAGKKPTTATCATSAGTRQRQLMSLEMFGGPLDGSEIGEAEARMLSMGKDTIEILDVSNLTVYYYLIDRQMQTCTYQGTKPLLDGSSERE